MEKLGKKATFKNSVAVVKLFFKRFSADHTTDLAATLAYYFLLSLFPLTIFMFSLLPYLDLTEKQLISFISQYVPEEVTALLRENMAGILKKSGSLLSIGILATIWSASNALNAVIRTLNLAYRVKETRSFLVTRSLSIILTLLMVFAIVMTLAINVVSAGVTRQLFNHLGLSDGFSWLWSSASLLISFVLIIIIFACLYKYAPNMDLSWRHVLIGAVIAGAGWQITSYAFSFYVRYFGNYSATYGTLGAIIILMLWFYLSAIMILIGGQINALLHHFRVHDERPD
ncbi:MAG: YihY/virulence factor BrkB family protein [Sporolactobacillus sp.]